jgi:8-oxo-dGTP diphosphatase
MITRQGLAMGPAHRTRLTDDEGHLCPGETPGKGVFQVRAWHFSCICTVRGIQVSGMFPLHRMPKAAILLLKESARHLLRRPVIGIVAAAQSEDGSWVLIRRADTRTWGMPGGTLEWGERLPECLARELMEEAGVELIEIESLRGVYSEPERDPRFHGVTVVARCRVKAPSRPPLNPLEILEVKAFALADIPRDFAFDMREVFFDAVSSAAPNLR